MGIFQLKTEFRPRGDQPEAIEKLAGGIEAGRRYQTLLGVTGSGKTYVMAQVISRFDRPVLVISHNKTLAAQLYSEFRTFFPSNAVEYFVSYYDYYQPEAYIPQTDIYIEKDASINEDLDRLRLSATGAVLSRRDCIIVASVSCIYGLGSPENFKRMVASVASGEQCDRAQLLRKLIRIQYDRNEVELARGRFRVRGNVVEVFPAHEESAIRIVLDGDLVGEIDRIDPLTGEVLAELADYSIYPAKHFVMPEGTIEAALGSIEAELSARLGELSGRGKLLEAQRLESRTRYDMEMLAEIGYCRGIENYSRHLAGRAPGSRPWTLMDYFPDDFIVIIDESHATLPQIRGMHAGDRARKEVLVEHGFRLPSALDNRPLRYEEFMGLVPTAIFASATPAQTELLLSGAPAELLIRPTGLVDPPTEVRPAEGQIEDLMGEIKGRVAAKERVLVTTLTKRLAEDVSEYLREAGIEVRYLHSEIDAIERVEILRDLRKGDFDVLVGVNLLREGLDLPEVSLVAILDADKEGFLRSRTALIQTIGRTARNVNGRVILYADRTTEAMRETIEETDRRRERQLAYNAEHGITPETIRKAITDGIAEIVKARQVEEEAVGAGYDRAELVRELEGQMYAAADGLRFEEAARIRDKIMEIQGKKKAMRERERGRGRKRGRSSS